MNRALDAVEKIREGWKVRQARDAPERLRGAEDGVEGLVPGRVARQRLRGLIERAPHRRSFACDERPGSRVELLRFAPGRRGCGSGRVFELGDDALGSGIFRRRPVTNGAHQDLQIIHGSDGQLPHRFAPGLPSLAQHAGQGFEAARNIGHLVLGGHEGRPAQGTSEPVQLRRVGGLRRGYHGIEAFEILPGLHGKEVDHPHRLGRWVIHGDRLSYCAALG